MAVGKINDTAGGDEAHLGELPIGAIVRSMSSRPSIGALLRSSGLTGGDDGGLEKSPLWVGGPVLVVAGTVAPAVAGDPKIASGQDSVACSKACFVRGVEECRRRGALDSAAVTSIGRRENRSSIRSRSSERSAACSPSALRQLDPSDAAPALPSGCAGSRQVEGRCHMYEDSRQ